MRKKLGDYDLTPEDLRQIAYFFSIVKASQKIDRLLKEQTGEEIGGQFLVGYEDRLFIIDNDFQVGETYDEFNSVGCGSDFALGCIYLLRDKKIPIENKIRQALEAAEHFSPFVKQPFIFETT